MTFEEFFKHCKFDFWESYHSGIPYVTVTFEDAFCEYQRSQLSSLTKFVISSTSSINKKLYFEDRKTAEKLAAKSLYEELIAVGEINDL